MIGGLLTVAFFIAFLGFVVFIVSVALKIPESSNEWREIEARRERHEKWKKERDAIFAADVAASIARLKSYNLPKETEEKLEKKYQDLLRERGTL